MNVSILNIILIFFINEQLQATLCPSITSWSTHHALGFIALDRHGRVLQEYQAEQLLQPASTMKVLTATAAYQKLRHRAPFRTTLTLYGKKKGALFTGDVVLEGTGDPSFNKDRLYQLIHELAQTGIRRISGRIILLDRRFDQQTHFPSTVWEEQRDCYAAPISSLTYEGNCHTITLQQKQRHVQVYPTTADVIPHIKFKNDCHDENTSSSHHTLYGQGAHVDHDPFQPTTHLRGCLQPATRKIKLALSQARPITALSTAFKQQCHRAGLQQIPHPQHRTAYQPTLPQYKQYHVNSDTLGKLTDKLLQQSSNSIGGHLFKSLAPSPAHWHTAEEEIKKALPWLDLKYSSIVDGTGLARTNRLSARQLATHLLYQLQKPSLHTLIKKLPNSSVQLGYLSKHIRELELPFPLYAKSGYLLGVKSLVGYIDPFGTNPLIFAIILNGGKETHNAFQELEPELLHCLNSLRHNSKNKTSV